MKRFVLIILVGISTVPTVKGQFILRKYTNYNSTIIGAVQQVKVREAGFSGLIHIPGSTNEFYTVSDRGFTVDAGISKCLTGKEKILPLPEYAPKIHRIRLSGDSIEILQSMTVKRPDGRDASGLPLPVGGGNTGEVLITGLTEDCSKMKYLGTDTWGVDPEGICRAADGSLWICEEFGTSIWHLDTDGKVITRYSPFGDGDHQVGIDSVLRYRRPNKGFEGIAITPAGKIYGFVQSTMAFPDKKVVDSTRITRIVEIDPVTGKTRMFLYINDGINGSGSEQIAAKDWEIGDAAAINDHEFLVIEHKAKKTNSQLLIYRIDIANATAITSDWVNGRAIEQYNDQAGLAAVGITPVTKTLFLDLNKIGWDKGLVKTEDMAIVNDSTIVIGIDNDYGIASTKDGKVSATGQQSVMFEISTKGEHKIKNYIPVVAKNGTASGK